MTKHMKLVKHMTLKFNVNKQNLDNKNFITNHMISVHDHPGEIYFCELCESLTSKNSNSSARETSSTFSNADS